jgi:hypothetical protein
MDREGKSSGGEHFLSNWKTIYERFQELIHDSPAWDFSQIKCEL